MMKFTGLEYLYIDIANHFGFTRLTWDDRITWTLTNIDKLEQRVDEAKDPLLYIKAINALNLTLDGVPTGHLMELDASASGLQLMACLIGCHTTAANVNLIDTSKRECIYNKVAIDMDAICHDNITREEIKHPLMTTLYGSKRQPRELFGEDTPELNAFYAALTKEVPGALEVMDDVQSCWNPLALAHTWHLPDNHVANVKVMVTIDKKIEVDELNHATFTHRAIVNQPTQSGISLMANVIQSIDGYVCREMIRKSVKQEFDLLTIHDSFWCHPNHMQQVRENYVNILADIADSDLLQNILSELLGENIIYKKYSNNLAPLIRQSNYALS